MRFITSAPLLAALVLAGCSAENSDSSNMAVADNNIEAAGDDTDEVPQDDSADTVPALSDSEDDVDDVDDIADEGSAANPDDPVAAVIPARFHGEWNQELSACGTGSNPTRLRISADTLHFYESAGDVREVEIVDDRVIEVTADYSGEGQTWTNERRLSLSEDGGTLTVAGEGATMTRSRCP
jgi:hypothetical protein